MIKVVRKSLGTFAILLALQLQSYGQATMANNDPDADFKLAKEFYQKEQYSLAYPLFKNISFRNNVSSNLPASTELEARYYSIVCGLKINDETAIAAAREFVALENNTARTQMLSFHIGEYYYRKQDFVQANEYFEKADISNLSNREIADMRFHQGYGYFTLQQFERAKPLFNSIRQIHGDPNYLDANYYYGFISFYEKNYKEALASFRIVETQPTYQKIVPYYITEILYFSGDKEQALKYGEDKLREGGQYYDTELRKLIGHGYFEKKNYEKALPYLEQYVNKSDKVRREDLYELAYCYYQTNQLTKAITGFKELGGKEDSLAQNSMYLLADAYLKTGQKQNARNAFLFSTSNSSNELQREISKFNYAKLSLELGYQDIALSELQSFVSVYPKSSYIPEAKELLVNVLTNTNNYKDALALYESLGTQTEAVKRLYPRILYGRSVELINDQQLEAADSLLTIVSNTPYNNALLPYVHFWKGEIAYRTSRVDNAIDHLNSYLKNPATNGEVNVTNARYNLGYAHVQKENFSQALGLFEQIAKNISSASSPLEQDAYVRTADAHFMNRNYAKASAMYDAIITNNLAVADYALYQRAIIAGAANRNAEKITILQSLPQRFPASTFVADANMEIANTYLAEENYRSAIAPLNNIINDKRATSLQPQAHLKLGIAYFNLDQDNEALNAFKRLVSLYPNSRESDDAVEYVRNIFVSQQKPEQYITFMKENGKNVSYTEEDSLTFASAEARFNSNDPNNALAGFNAYLTKFPEGRYAIAANYYAAELYDDKKDFANAAKAYELVASKAPNKYAEKSVLQAARINFFELKDYAKSEQLFIQLKSIATQPESRLESMRGLLRAQYRLNKWTEAVTNAQDLLTQKGIATDDRMMANMVIAKAAQQGGQLNEASDRYRELIAMGNNEFAAEARYQMAAILFQQNNYAAAEKAAFDVIKKAGSYAYWTTKSYLLLGDVYWKQKDYFNAEATFKSVAENATISELKDEAFVKLRGVVEEKNKASKVQQ
jgi:TolA-binding protein